jgi:hypothetical protein
MSMFGCSAKIEVTYLGYVYETLASLKRMFIRQSATLDDDASHFTRNGSVLLATSLLGKLFGRSKH